MKTRTRRHAAPGPEDGPPPVDETAAPDGFVEVVGRIAGEGLLIQGWTTGAIAGATEVVAETRVRCRHAAVLATFPRDDLKPGAGGVLAILPEADIDPAAIRRCHLKVVAAWRRLDLFGQRTLLPDGDAAGHLRHMLAKLEATDADRRTLRRLAAPRYAGHDTVSGSALPVRAAIDLAVRVPGAGVWLSGWLLDPTRRVEAATLNAGRWSVRADGEWMRAVRRDVTEGFAQNPRFAPLLAGADDRHGFAGFVPVPDDVAADAAFHLELAVGEDAFLFLPVSPVPPNGEFVRRILCAVDPDDPAADALIARHVVPPVRAAERPVPGPATVHDLGPARPDPRLSVVIPVVDGREDVDLSLARLAVDPDLAQGEVLVVAGAASNARLPRAVRAAAGFYRLTVRLVLAPRARDAIEAIAAAVPHVRAARVLLLSTAVVPPGGGWLGDLERAAMRPGRPAMASPTILYEDHSVRFAGIVLDDAALPVAQYAGYPADWIRDAEPRPVAGASLDCAMLPRAWLETAVRAGGEGFVGPERKALDLSLRIAAAGGPCLWIPAVRVVAVDEAPRAGDEPWRRAAAVVDRLAFAATWPRVANATVGAAP
jgi:O-antigen biosynthesis protein